MSRMVKFYYLCCHLHRVGPEESTVQSPYVHNCVWSRNMGIVEHHWPLQLFCQTGTNTWQYRYRQKKKTNPKKYYVATSQLEGYWFGQLHFLILWHWLSWRWTLSRFEYLDIPIRLHCSGNAELGWYDGKKSSACPFQQVCWFPCTHLLHMPVRHHPHVFSPLISGWFMSTLGTSTRFLHFLVWDSAADINLDVFWQTQW